MTVAGQITDEQIGELLSLYAGVPTRSAKAIVVALTELQHRREAEAVAWRWRYDDPAAPGKKLGWFFGPIEPPPNALGRSWSGWECEPLSAASPSSPASGVRVNPLRWELSLHNNVWVAKSIIGVYHIHIEGGRHQAWMESFVSGKIDQWDGPDRGDLYAAQADADAHYSATILSALGEHP